MTEILRKKLWHGSKIPEFPQCTVWKLVQNFCLTVFQQNNGNFFRENNAVNTLFNKMASVKLTFDQFPASVRKNVFSSKS